MTTDRFLQIVRDAAWEDPAALANLPGAAARLLASSSGDEDMPIPALARKDFARVMEAALSDFTVKRAWAFVNDGKVVIRATRRFKQTSRDTRGELLVTFGAPNFAERRQLASMRRRGVAVPKGVQTKPFPAKKKAAAKKRKTA